MVTVAETELCTAGCFRVAEWQVIVLNLVGKKKLELEPPRLAPDFHNSVAYYDPSDVASGGGCVIVPADECFGFLECP